MEKRRNAYRQERLGKRFIMVLLFLCITTSGLIRASVFAQATVTVNMKNVTLSDVLWEIQKQTDFTFIYSTNDTKNVRVENLSVKNKPISNVLDKCLQNSGLAYSVHNGVITIHKAKTHNTNKPHNTKTTTIENKKYTILGKVTDESGEPIIGANVFIKGTKHGTVSDINGNFNLQVKDNKAVLTVSYIGFTPKEVAVVAEKAAHITLKVDNNLLEEVIVTGYGTFKKSAYAGSASTVKTEAVKDVPNVSFQQMLEGAAPGVSVSSSSGIPGASTSIRIRGMGSFNASNSPLYVVDGVPVLSGNIGASGSDSGLDVMSTLNTSDIESITVIKDAAAASLYGSRAANGVVIITTKQGKSGKPVFSLKSDWGFSKFAVPYREIMGGQERRNLIHEGLRNYALSYKGSANDEEGLHQNMTENEAWAYADANIDQYAPIPWCGFVNWDDYLFRNGSHQNYEFSASGGQERIKYYTSLGYMKQEGVTINSELERVSARLNVEYKMAKWMTIGAKIQFSKVNQDTYSEGGSYTSPIYGTRNGATPSDPVWNEDGTWNRELIKLADRNPVLSNTYNFKKEYATRSFNTVYATFNLWKNLKFTSTYSYDFVMNKSRAWKDPRTSDGDDDNGRFSKDYNDITNMTWSNILTYQMKLNKKHNLDFLAGYEINSKESDGLGTTISNFARTDKPEISNGVVYQSMGGSNSCTRIVSYITRVNYDYENKYYAGASWRTDGSSRLARENRWGNFWSISGAWRVSAEKFMKPTKDWLNDLKLRVSYGVNGTLPSTYYGYLGLSSITSNYNNNPGISQSQLENKNLTWETNYNFNSGIDLALFDNRLNITFEYYIRTTKNLLYERPLSLTTGFSNYLSNIGKLQNKGYELELRSTNINTKDFRWTSSFNLGHNANKILKLDGDLKQVTSGSMIRKVGLPYSTYYMIEFAGIDPADGEPMFYKNTTDENGKLNRETTKDPRSAEKVILKCADPTITGGFGNSFSYKWFDFNFNLNFSLGAWNYDGCASKLEHGGDGTLNIPTYYRKRWQKEGDHTNIERFVIGRSISMADYSTSRRLHSGDFLRLKNLTFGITLPKNLIRRIGLEKVRIYASGNNLLTWAAYSYIDPESGSSPSWDTPPMRTCTFGLEIKF